MTILVTGAAGFIGSNVCKALLAQGEHVIGVDSLNDYYEVSLKQYRLDQIDQLDHDGKFDFYKVNIADREAMEGLKASHKKSLIHIIHLAAQAGVRYSLDHPFAYLESNLTGHLVMLELCRNLPNLAHMVYASSSSVYGGNTKTPFSVQDRTDHPVSLYAATKKADELMSHTYQHLYAIPMTGLRFFTVYGEAGRPDMAYFSFTRDILSGTPIRVFNHGDMRRDFTYINDIVSGVLAAKDRIPEQHTVYNLGNNKPVALLDFIEVLERALGKEAEKIMEPMQPGDVYETYADITESQQDLGYQPTTSIEEGLPKFVQWYQGYYK